MCCVLGNDWSLIRIRTEKEPTNTQTYTAFAGYGLSSLPVLVNNVAFKCKAGESLEEKYLQYSASVSAMLKGFQIDAVSQVILQDACREDILMRLFSVTDSFPWQTIEAKHEMNFNESDQAVQAVMERYDQRINELIGQLNANQREMQRLMEEARIREEKQREKYEAEIAALRQQIANMPRGGPGGGGGICTIL